MPGSMDAFSSFEAPKKDEEVNSDKEKSVDSSRVDIMDMFGGTRSDNAGSEQKKEIPVSGGSESRQTVQKSSTRGTTNSQGANRFSRQSSGSKNGSSYNDIDSASQMFVNKTKSDSKHVNKEEKAMPSQRTSRHIRVRKDDSQTGGDYDFSLTDQDGIKAAQAKPNRVGKDSTAKGVTKEAPKTPNKSGAKSSTRGGAKDSAKIKLFRHSQPSVSKIAVDILKYKLLERRFKKGRLILALDKDDQPLMYLYQLGNELMAYKYLGTSLEVSIPAYVGNLPVRYVHGGMFTRLTDFVDRNSMRNLKSNLTGKDVIKMNASKFKESFNGIKKIVFPETLVELPGKLLYQCYSVKEIVIPASVVNVSKWFLFSSGVRDIYFNGPVPEEFHNCSISQDIFVHVAVGGAKNGEKAVQE